MANFITKGGMERSTIIGYPDVSASTIAILLNKNFYYPRSGSFSTYVIWNNKRVAEVNDDSVINTFLQYQREVDEVLLITSKPVNDSFLRRSKIKLLKSFTPAIEETEEFHLYK